MNDLQQEKLNNIFRKYPHIKLVYFFGSRSQGKEGPMSDYDFGVYADLRDSKRLFDLRVKLMDEVGRLFKTDKVDIVILNTAKSSELKYQVISTGKLIYEEEPFKVLVEPRILNEYFDFMEWIGKRNRN